MSRLAGNPTYIRVRAVLGAFFVVLGAVIIVSIVRRVGLRFEAVPGIALGGAMMALGVVRVRAWARRERTP